MQLDGTMNVLVVDDELEMAEMIADELRDRGYGVVALNSSVEALDFLKRENFDMLITDLRMPHVDGLSLLRASRKLDPSRPVIVITGHGAIDTALEAHRQGAFQYLTKPFSLVHLLDLMRAALAPETPGERATDP